MNRLAFAALTLVAALAPRVEAQALNARWGIETDTNPERAEAGSDADVGTRYLIGYDHYGRASDHVTVAGSGLLGGRFTQQTPEGDTQALQTTLRAAWIPDPHWSASPSVFMRVFDDGVHARTYQRARLLQSASYRGGPWTIRLGGGWSRFHFAPNDALSARGPTGNGRLTFAPSDDAELQLDGHAELRHLDLRRRYTDGTIEVVGTEGTVDRVYGGRAGALFTWDTVRVEARVGYTINASNSLRRSYTRSSFRGALTYSPSAVWTLYVQGTVQSTAFRDGALADDSFALEDENRNAAVVTVERLIGAGVGVQARYSLYTQAFQGDDTGHFRRHLAYVGLSYAPDTD